MQDKDDFEDLSAPTASLESIFNTLKIVVEEDREILILDAGGAYLNAKIDKEVYMALSANASKVLVNIMPEVKNCVDEKGRILCNVRERFASRSNSSASS